MLRLRGHRLLVGRRPNERQVGRRAALRLREAERTYDRRLLLLLLLLPTPELLRRKLEMPRPMVALKQPILREW